jgi:class 3 adenylate cyclase
MNPPSGESIRKLSAILFADIQGYTALMQKDEKTAFALLEKYQSSLESLVYTECNNENISRSLKHKHILIK